MAREVVGFVRVMGSFARSCIGLFMVPLKRAIR